MAVHQRVRASRGTRRVILAAFLTGLNWVLPAGSQVAAPLESQWDGVRVTQPYACFDCVNKETTRGKFHQGLDIRPCGSKRSDGYCNYAASGTEVLAAADGQICRVIVNGESDIGFGNAVIVRHEALDGEGRILYSLYAHMEEADPAKFGTTVGVGEVLGTMGGSGSGLRDKYDPHLHFAVMQGSVANRPGVTEEPVSVQGQTISKCSFAGMGYSEQHPLNLGFVDPWPLLLPLQQPVVIEVVADTRQASLRLRDGPGPYNGSTLSVLHGQRFVAYAATSDRSWYLVDLPCGQGAVQFPPDTNRACSGWVQRLHEDCVPDGACIRERPDIPFRDVAFAGDGGVSARTGPGTAFEKASKVWGGQGFVRRRAQWSARDAPDSYCDGQWDAIDTPREFSAGEGEPLLWICSHYLAAKRLSQGGCRKVRDAVAATETVPACPYVDESRYLAECLTIPRGAVATESLTLFSGIGSGLVVGTVARGDVVRAIAYQRWSVGCPVRTRRDGEAYGDRLEPGVVQIQRGETLFHLKYVGEGAARFWRQGTVLQAEDMECSRTLVPSSDCWYEPMTSCDGDAVSDWGPDAIEWVQVEASSGTLGWTNEIAGLQWSDDC